MLCLAQILLFSATWPDHMAAASPFRGGFHLIPLQLSATDGCGKLLFGPELRRLSPRPGSGLPRQYNIYIYICIGIGMHIYIYIYIHIMHIHNLLHSCSLDRGRQRDSATLAQETRRRRCHNHHRSRKRGTGAKIGEDPFSFLFLLTSPPFGGLLRAGNARLAGARAPDECAPRPPGA